MISLDEFRESYINEDINAAAVNTSRYPIEVFIDSAVDILQNDYCLISGMEHCYYEFNKGTRAYRNMRIDAAYLDLPSNTLDLLYADFNDGEAKLINNEFITGKSQLLINYFENVLKGFFVNAEQADPAVQLARDVKANVGYIYKLHLFIVSTDKLSSYVKKLDIPDFTYGGQKFKVDLDVLDIEKIYRSRMAGFQKEDVIINCSDFGIDGIPCIKAEIETEQYDSYLAIVPGQFLCDIYKKYSSSLLESNVRSFLKFNGGVNKGIRGTILNEKSRFFTYNNGISTTAAEVTVENTPSGAKITSFENLQIINGGQTTATLAATSIKNNADLSGIYVQMKLTVLRDSDPDLIRYIATYANSQNKVKTADLNSSHPFYVRIEEYSRKVYAPISSGQIVQQLWFFERARGQYDQPLMQMTKKQRDDYKLVRPKNKKFTLTDLAKYANASEMLPYYVSWGGEVNAARFHTNMLKQWIKNDNAFNELYYKELIGKKILFEHIGNIISDQEWYQERRAYRPQLIAYTFSKLVSEVKAIKREINYKLIWDTQSVPDCLDADIARIAKVIFDVIYDENRPTTNIETYCKREECWNAVQKQKYDLSDECRNALVTQAEKEADAVVAKKEQKFTTGIDNEIGIFNKGTAYWQDLITRGKSQEVLNYADIKALNNAVNFCNLVYTQLSPYQVKEIIAVVAKLKENGIE